MHFNYLGYVNATSNMVAIFTWNTARTPQEKAGKAYRRGRRKEVWVSMWI